MDGQPDDLDEPIDYAAVAKSGADYVKTSPPYKKRPGWIKWLIIVVLILAIVGAGGWYFFKYKKTTNKPANSTPQAQTVNKKTIASETKNYVSPEFYLSFDYPSDWTITDTSGTGVLTAKSTPVTLVDANNQSMTGQVTLTVRAKTQVLPEFDHGNAVAERDSEKIAYAKPTPSQRAQTYVSYLQYATTVANKAIDGVYITGDFGYKAGQAIPKVDIGKLDPIITLTFAKCTDSTCAKTTPMAISDSNWNDASLSKPLLDILRSLTIS